MAHTLAYSTNVRCEKPSPKPFGAYSSVALITPAPAVARHAVLAIVSLAAGVALADLLVEGVTVGIGNGQPVVAAGAAASLAALAWVAVRSLRLFRGGIRRPARPQ